MVQLETGALEMNKISVSNPPIWETANRYIK